MESILIVFWSGTGNTEAMAKGIAKGIEAAGEMADVFDVCDADSTLINAYTKIAFGCPSMGIEELEENEFEPFFESVEDLLVDKKLALFGSYGWGDGEWMESWIARTRLTGAKIMGEGFVANLEPDEEACIEFGKQFADF